MIDIFDGGPQGINFAQFLFLAAARKMLPQIVERGIYVSHAVPFPFVPPSYRRCVVAEVIDVITRIQQVFPPSVAVLNEIWMLVTWLGQSWVIHRRHSWHFGHILSSRTRVVVPVIRGADGRGLLESLLPVRLGARIPPA